MKIIITKKSQYIPPIFKLVAPPGPCSNRMVSCNSGTSRLGRPCPARAAVLDTDIKCSKLVYVAVVELVACVEVTPAAVSEFPEPLGANGDDTAASHAV